MATSHRQVWAVRIDAPKEDEWREFTVGIPVNKGGAAGVVHTLLDSPRPEIVAKVYKGEVDAQNRASTTTAQRITALVQNNTRLNSELGFATWPKHLLFLGRKPETIDHVKENFIGFTMERLPGTTSIEQLLTGQRGRIRLTPEHTLHILLTLADQLARLHGHPLRFVVGDLSPANIHVTHDFKHVRLIDTDSYQFTCPVTKVTFKPTGFTPLYRSPGIETTVKTRQGIAPAHDAYVFAILVFRMLMADHKTSCHPFSTMDEDEDTLIDRRHFPFDDSTRYPLPARVKDAYRSLPESIRALLTRAFTTADTPPLKEWIKVLAQRRCLQ